MGPSPPAPASDPVAVVADVGSARKSRFRAVALSVVPWIVAFTALAWVFRLVKWRDLEAALGHVDVVQFVAVSMVAVGGAWLADAFAMWRAFAILGGRASYRDMVVLRGTSYLIAAFQYYLGQAAIAAFLVRRGIPVARATGWLLFVTAVNFGTLLVLAALGAVAAGLATGAVRSGLVAVAVACVAYAAILQSNPARLARMPVLDALFKAGVSGHVRALFARLPHVGVLIAWNAYSLHAFGVHIPFTAVAALVPIAVFAGALPLGAMGLGILQAASVLLFAPYGGADGRAAVLASSLAMSSVGILLQLIAAVALIPAGVRIAVRNPAE